MFKWKILLTLQLVWFCSCSLKHDHAIETKFGSVKVDLIENDADFDKSDEDGNEGGILEIKLNDLVDFGEKVHDPNWISDTLFGTSMDQKSKIVDQMDLKKSRSKLKQFISNMVSTACLSDLAFWLDSFVEYILAQNDLATTCRARSKSSMMTNSTLNCSCAPSVQENIDRNAWTLDVIDSLGRLSTGSMKGNLWMLGDYEQCRNISVPKGSSQDLWEGRYSRVDIFFYKNQLIRPFFEHEYASIFFDTETVLNTLQFPSSKPDCDIIIQIKLGFCMPKSCNKADIKKLIGHVTQLPQKVYKKRIVCAVDLFYHGDLEIHADKSAIILTIFLLALFALIVFGTIYDYKVHENVLPMPMPSAVSFTETMLTPDTTKPNGYAENEIAKPDDLAVTYPMTSKILLSFSIIANARKLFDLSSEKGTGRITCIHGIRALSIIWVIFAHTYSSGLLFVDNVMTVLDMPKYLLNQIILNGSLSVDAFFLVGGALLAYLWLKEAKKTKGKNVTNPKAWLMFYVHRYLRLTPVYALMLAIEIILVKYSGGGPLWSVIGFEQNTCSKGWWANLLYINNFIDLKEMCMVWSWYLSNDMQFFFFSPPLLIVLWMNYFAGIALISTLLVGFTVLRGLLIISNPSFPPLSILFNDFIKIQQMEEFSRVVYIKPYCRCGPYLLGLLLGAVLFRCQLKAKIPKVLNFLGWILATVSGLVALFGVFEFCKTGHMEPSVKFLYGSLVRTMWAAFIAWIIFVCATGHGGIINRILSSRKWRPISRMSYCAYLVHPIIVMYFYAIFALPVHYGGHFQLGMYFIGHTVVTFFFAFFLCCGFEMPVTNLENELFKRGTNSPQKNYRQLKSAASRVTNATNDSGLDIKAVKETVG